MPRGFETTTGGGSGGGAATGGVAQAAFDALANEVAKKDNKVTPGLDEILIVDALGNQLPSGKKFSTDNTMGGTIASDALSPTQKAVYDFVQAVKTALIGGASLAGDTLKELEDRIIAIELAFAVGADADTIINRVTELYQLVENIPEGTSLLLELNKRLQYGAITDRPVAAISNNNMFWLDDTGIYKSDGTTWIKLFNTAADSAANIVYLNSDTSVDTTGWVPDSLTLFVCETDCNLDLAHTRVTNRRPNDAEASGSNGTTTWYQTRLKLLAGEAFYILYRSPTESRYIKLREPKLSEAAVQYWAEYWVSNESGLPTNHGKSIEAPYQTVADFAAGWIDFGSRVNLMSDYGHQGGWTLTDQNYITFEGAGKTTMMYGGNEIAGLCEHITFRNLAIANDITWGGQQAIKFTDVRGKHVIDNLWTELNTAAYYLEFGVNCYNGTADGVTTFGALACTIKNSDLTGSTGIIKLNDLGAGQYAYIKLENTQVSGIEAGTGWHVLYDGSSDLGTLTYTGSGSIFKVIPTSNSVPQKIGGLMTRDMNKLLIELQPTAENQVLKSVYMLGNFVGLQWATATDYPGLNQQVTNQSGSNMSAMLHQFKVSDGNYQSFDIVIDMWESGLGSGLFSRYVKLSGVFRMDLIQASGTVNIANYIDKDQSNAPKGTLSLNYSAGGYGGPAVELNYQCLVPFTNLNINKRVLTHTFGN